MITVVAVIVLCVVLGILGLLVTYRVVKYLFDRRKRRSSVHKAASAISGNLVQEHLTEESITANYRLTKILLGRGSSAEVFVGENIANHHRYAVKIIDLSRKDIIWRYEREKNFLKDIEHCNVVRLFEVYTTPKQMFFVMELCTGGHLGHLLKRQENVYKNLPELKARNFILQITRAIMHCHEHGICHRDIKLQNILLENNSPDAQVKIVDFGNAVRFLGCTPLKKVVGTTYTAAPEVFRQHYDERCDVWSLGVVAYILLSGRRPFEKADAGESSNNPKSPRGFPPLTVAEIREVLPPIHHHHASASLIASILLGRYHFDHEVFQSISAEAIDFIQTCLVMDYTKRAAAMDLLDHPWLRAEFLYLKTVSSKGETLECTDNTEMVQLGNTPPAGPTNHNNNNINNSSNNNNHNNNPIQIGDNHLSLTVSRSFYELPQLSEKGIQTLLSSTKRRLSHVEKTGMRDTTMLAVAFTMPVTKIKQIRNLFQEIDRNGNGLIEKNEFRTVMLMVQEQLTMVEIDQLYDSIDLDGNGSISFLEFVAAMIDPAEIDINHMHEAFRLLDKERKGYLTKTDLLRVLQTETVEASENRERFEQQLPSTSLPLASLSASYSPSKQASPSRLQLQSSLRRLSTSSKQYHNTRAEEMESDWQREVERRKMIEAKVTKIFEEADLNGDGRLSYPEFLFAMAEGSMKFKDLLENSPQAALNHRYSPFTPQPNRGFGGLGSGGGLSHIKSTSALPRSPGLYARRQSEGNLKRKFPSFQTITNSPKPGFIAAVNPVTPNLNNNNTPKGSILRLLSSFFPLSNSPTRQNSVVVYPETLSTAPMSSQNPSSNLLLLSQGLYVDNPSELKHTKLEPVDYLEDSPVPDNEVEETEEGESNQKKEPGGGGGDEKKKKDTGESSPTASRRKKGERGSLSRRSQQLPSFLLLNDDVEAQYQQLLKKEGLLDFFPPSPRGPAASRRQRSAPDLLSYSHRTATGSNALSGMTSPGGESNRLRGELEPPATLSSDDDHDNHDHEEVPPVPVVSLRKTFSGRGVGSSGAGSSARESPRPIVTPSSRTPSFTRLLSKRMTSEAEESELLQSPHSPEMKVDDEDDDQDRDLIENRHQLDEYLNATKFLSPNTQLDSIRKKFTNQETARTSPPVEKAEGAGLASPRVLSALANTTIFQFSARRHVVVAPELSQIEKKEEQIIIRDLEAQ